MSPANRKRSPQLTKNLHWRVTLANGTERAREDVPGLVVALVTTDVHVPVGGRPQVCVFDSAAIDDLS